MVLKLYGHPMTAYTRLVAHVCKELNISYELITIDLFKGEQKGAEFLALQPFGQVPVIDDGGFQLYESRAICRYLVLKAGSPLLPTSDLRAIAKFEQAASIEHANFDSLANRLAYEKIIKKQVTGVEPDEALATQLLTSLSAKLAGYEVILSKQKYLAGDEITLADFFHLPFGHLLETTLGYDILQTKPNVARWWNELQSRPAWQSVKDGA